MVVDRPPRTRNDALRLAYEQSIYDPDWDAVINQEHLVDLAATLLDSEVWQFWWDRPTADPPSGRPLRRSSTCCHECAAVRARW